jgi:hypothetical protein
MPLFLAFFIGMALLQTAMFDQQRTLTGTSAEKSEYDTMREIERYRWFARAASLKLRAEDLPEGGNTASYDWDDIKNHPALPGFVSSSHMPDSWRVKANSHGWVICSDISETAVGYMLAHLPREARQSKRQPAPDMTVLADPRQSDPSVTQNLAQLCT